jgi:hypothetical protein
MYPQTQFASGRARIFPQAQANNPDEKRLRILAGLILVCLLSFVVYRLCYSEPDHLSGVQIALAISVVVLGFVPTLHYLCDQGRPPVPYLPIVGCFYAIAFGFPAFYDPRIMIDRFNRVSTEALLLIVAGELSLYACYYLFRGAIAETVPPFRIVQHPRYRSLRIALWVLMLLHFVLPVAAGLADLASLTHFAYAAAYIAYGMFLMLWYRGVLSPPEKVVLLLICAPAELVSRLATGSLAHLVRLAVFLILIVWVYKRRIPWKLLTVGIFLFAVLNEAKIEYRRLAWFSGPFESANAIEKTQLFFDLAISRITNSRDYSDRAQSALLSRTSQIGFLTHVMDQTPRVVPFWGGESYKSLLYILTPRILWPDKPVQNLGYEFSYRYGMRGFHDTSTSFNVPWIIEMYANFGWIGTLTGMGIVGLLFAAIEARFSRNGMAPLEIVMGTALFFDLGYQESNFALMTGLKVLLYGSFKLYFILMLPRSRRAGARIQGQREALFRARPTEEISTFHTASCIRADRKRA